MLVVSVFLLISLLVSSSLVLLPFSSASLSQSNDIEKAAYEIVSNSNIGSMSISGKWVVPTASHCQTSGSVLYSIVIFPGYQFAASQMDMSCSGNGASPTYSMSYLYQGVTTPLPSADKIKPGDKMSAVLTFSSTTKALNITIKASTAKGVSLWTFPFTGTDNTGPQQIAGWELTGPANSLPLNFTTLKTSGDKATMGGHRGVLGSFIASFTVEEITYVDGSKVLAQPSSITSTSSSFKITWMAYA